VTPSEVTPHTAPSAVCTCVPALHVALVGAALTRWAAELVSPNADTAASSDEGDGGERHRRLAPEACSHFETPFLDRAKRRSVACSDQHFCR
jgi:hypothetical protein